MPIFDQGYQHWNGAVSGHLWRWLTIAMHGVRSGLKERNTKLLLLLAWLPALVLVAVLCLWGLVEQKFDLVMSFARMIPFLSPRVLANPVEYRLPVWTVAFSYFMALELRVAMLLILLVGPSLISQDLRFNALPLYLSRPLRRIDYFMGKLGIIGAFLGMTIIVPLVIAYVFGLLFSLDITIIRDTTSLLLSALLYGLIIAVSAGLLILALSSLSRNSRYIALFWLGIWFVSGIVAVALSATNTFQRQYDVMRKAEEAYQAENPGAAPGDGEARPRPRGGRRGGPFVMPEEFVKAELEASKTNWRPLVSYVSNLSRVGDALLGTSACWKSISESLPPEVREPFLLGRLGPQYPWYWSAIVLTVLAGFSVCILQRRIRSLDRLK